MPKKKGGRSSFSTADDELAAPNPNAGKTKTITFGSKQFRVEWLDEQAKIIGKSGTRTNPHKFERYSNNKDYLCGAKIAFGEGLCDMFFPAFGNRLFGITPLGDEDAASSTNVWLCANCQQHFGLLEGRDRRDLVPQSNKYIEVALTTGENKTNARLCKGSCIDFAEELSSNDHIIIRVEPPPPAEEMRDPKRMNILFKVERPGKRRGSKHRSCRQGSYEDVYKTLMECSNVSKVWTKIIEADGSRFYYVIPALYHDGDSIVSFVPHVDIPYLGKPEKRSNWTIYMHKLGDGVIGKVMRFQDRQTGWWFDIHCTHGTIVEQSKYASGIHVVNEEGVLKRSPISHAVFNGNKTCTITWDHGKKCDGTKRGFTQAEIKAAWEVVDDKKDDGERSDDEKDDGEFSDDDSDAKKPAAK